MGEDDNISTASGERGNTTPTPSSIDQAFRDLQAREANQDKLLDLIAKAEAEAQKWVRTDDAVADDPTTPAVDETAPARTTITNETAYKAASDKALKLREQYQIEGRDIYQSYANLNSFIVQRQDAADRNSLEYAKLEQQAAEAKKMEGYYQAQVNNWDAQRAKDKAQADYDAAYNATFTATDKATADKAALEARGALDRANATLVNTQAEAQRQVNAYGSDTAKQNLNLITAQAASAGSQATIDAATAANAPAKAAGEAASAVGAGQVATAQGAHADEAVTTEIREAAARAGLSEVQAQEILALIDNKVAYGQAQIEQAQATAENQRLQTHQLSQGDVATKIEQYGKAIQEGEMTPEDADAAMEDYLSGSTRFQRQTQREAQISGAMNSALQYGMVVPRGQQYIPGTEPGGQYARAFAGLGAPMPSVRLDDQQTVQQYVAGQGIQMQEPQAPHRFDATGAYVGQPATQPLGMVSAPGHVPIQETTEAQLLGQPQAQAAQPVVQPAASGGTFGPEWVPYAVPPGWSGGAPYRGGYGLPQQGYSVDPLTGQLMPPEARMAMGGTATVPRAMLGMGQTPTVQKPPLFANQARDGRPSMFARGR